ncbi:MAG: hypothetical protein RR577_04375 [Erysipelotrichales bacterium]
MEENKNTNKLMPWQFSSSGLIVGFLFGIIPFFVALLGNHQFKQGKEVDDLRVAYNVILILSIVLIGLLFLLFIFMGMGAAYMGSGHFSSDEIFY